MSKRNILSGVVLSSFMMASAHSQSVFQHPAMLQNASVFNVDASKIVTHHPAGGYNGEAQHANHEHPAVVAAREAQAHTAPLDSNTYLVLPPASTVWTQGPADAPVESKVTVTTAAVATH